jgi:hypothetical protein
MLLASLLLARSAGGQVRSSGLRADSQELPNHISSRDANPTDRGRASALLGFLYFVALFLESIDGAVVFEERCDG